MSNSKTTLAKQHKIQCNICLDAGKDINIVTSHRTRDNTGKVVCPILLSQKCNYCKEVGHTPKYCPIIKEKEKQKRSRNFQRSKPNLKPFSLKISSKNYFELFGESSDESSDEEITNKETNSICVNLNSAWYNQSKDKMDIIRSPPVLKIEYPDIIDSNDDFENKQCNFPVMLDCINSKTLNISNIHDSKRWVNMLDSDSDSDSD